MTDATLITDIAVVVGVAAVTGTVTRALRQPSILGYLLAGLIVGPYIPIPLFADVERVHELSEFGVVLVMFAVGLEFSLDRAGKVLPIAGLTAVVQIGGMFWIGTLLGDVFGLSSSGAVVLGGSVAISSTMVVTKVFDVHPPPGDVRSAVLGVLVLQDLAAILLITVVSAVAEGAAVAPSALLSTVGRLLGVMAVGIVLGLWAVPRLTRQISGLRSAEVNTVFAVGLCFALAAVMEHLGYSPALGAFLGGMLVAESGLGHRFEHLMAPLRDVFAAIFFVSVGMTVDPLLALDNLGEAALVAGVVVVSQALLVTTAGLLSGQGLRSSAHAGIALGQVGEFGFIIMGIGVAGGVVPPLMFTTIAVVAVLTTCTTPLLLRITPAILFKIEHHLPYRIRTNLSIYAAWVDGLRRGDGVSPARRSMRRALQVLAIDVGVVAAIVVAMSITWDAALVVLVERAGLPDRIAPVVLVATTALVAYPFARGLWRASRALGGSLATVAFPPLNGERPDLTYTARRAMAMGLQLGALLGACLLVVAITQPFVPFFVGLALLVAALAPSGLLLWRSGGPLKEHVRSATLALVQALRQPELAEEPQLHDLLHGLGDATPIRVEPGFAAAGMTLAQLDLRAVSGATVLAIARAEGNVTMPTGHEELRAGDILAVAGPQPAIERARVRLSDGGSRAEVIDEPSD